MNHRILALTTVIIVLFSISGCGVDWVNENASNNAHSQVVGDGKIPYSDADWEVSTQKTSDSSQNILIEQGSLSHDCVTDTTPIINSDGDGNMTVTMMTNTSCDHTAYLLTYDNTGHVLSFDLD
jgi:hypothetical protein